MQGTGHDHTVLQIMLRIASRSAAIGRTGKPRACGVFEGPGDLARNADSYLAESGFGER